MKLSAVIFAAATAPLTLAHGDEGGHSSGGHDDGSIHSHTTSDFVSEFQSAGIVPEVLAAFNPSVSFYAGYMTDAGKPMLLAPGMNLTANEAKLPFEFSVENITNAANITQNTRYLIYMIGPDAPSRATPTARNVRHYLAGNFTLSSTPSSLLPSALKFQNISAAASEYQAPNPAAGSGAHRYIYLLYTQPPALNTRGFESFGVNLTNRQQFNLSQFRQQAGLGPSIGGTFFTISAAQGSGSGSGSGNGNGSNTAVPGGASSSLPQMMTLVTAFAAFLAYQIAM